MRKKLQVFISSTYTDLVEERQAAVQAVLAAGHIPAGMELFTAGNESQLKTIYKWIDNSDVYMLILGGRYGSIEPTSGKSYTQLEYEYALSNNIPMFTVVLTQDYLTRNINRLQLSMVMENINPELYNRFKQVVMTKIVKPVDDCKDISIAVHSTLNEFLDEYNLIGWVRGGSDDTVINLLKDNNKLLTENLQYTKEIQKLEDELELKNKNMIGDNTYEELKLILSTKYFELPRDLIKSDGESKINALKLFIILYESLCIGVNNQEGMSDLDKFIFYECAPYFLTYGLLERVKLSGTTTLRIHTSKSGLKFYSLLLNNEV